MKRFLGIFVPIVGLAVVFLLFWPKATKKPEFKTGEKLLGYSSSSGRSGAPEVVPVKEALRRSNARFESQDINYQRSQAFDNSSSLFIEIKRLESELGTGASFYSQIVNLFRDCPVSIDELLEIIGGIEDQEIKENAMYGLVLKFGKNEDKKLREMLNLSSLVSHEIGQEVAAQAFSTYVFSGSSSLLSERMVELAGVLKGEEFSKEIVDDVALEIARGLSTGDDVEFFLDSFLLDSDLGFMEDEARQKSLFEKLKQGAAVGALQALGHNADLTTEAGWILGKNSLAFSPKEVAHLSNSKNEGIRAAFVEHEIYSGDLLDARNMLDSYDFNSEAIKKKLEWHLWNFQKNEISEKMRENPLETVVDLTSGGSNYEDYMLEAAVTSWISRDPNQAAEWVEANIDQMKAGTRQYVAASYAKEAAAQGDLTTARQWANLIQDEKTLTRINGILEKAEQAASN